MPIQAGHIAPQDGGYEAQRSYNYEVEIYGVPGARVINLSVQSMDLPQPSSEVIEINFGAERRKIAGQVNFEDQELVCVDYCDQPTFSSLMKWRKLVYNEETGLTGMARNYKKKASVIMYSPDESITRVYEMEGVFPLRVNGERLDYTNNDKQTITCQLSVDLAIPKF